MSNSLPLPILPLRRCSRALHKAHALLARPLLFLATEVWLLRGIVAAAWKLPKGDGLLAAGGRGGADIRHLHHICHEVDARIPDSIPERGIQWSCEHTRWWWSASVSG